MITTPKPKLSWPAPRARERPPREPWSYSAWTTPFHVERGAARPVQKRKPPSSAKIWPEEAKRCALKTLMQLAENAACELLLDGARVETNESAGP